MTAVFDGTLRFGVIFIENIIAFCIFQLLQSIGAELVRLSLCDLKQIFSWLCCGNCGFVGFCLLSCFAGVRGAGGQNSDADDGCTKHCPESGLFPFCHIHYATFRVSLTEGKGRQRNEAVRRCKTQQRSSVLCPDFRTVHANHRFIAAHLHVLCGQYECQPHQRIEPVDAQGDIAKQLPEGIPSLDVAALVGNNVPSLSFRQSGGKIDLRADQALDEGGRDVVPKVDILPQSDSSGDFYAEPCVGINVVYKQYAHAQEPYDNGKPKRIAHRLCRCLLVNRVRDRRRIHSVFRERRGNFG